MISCAVAALTVIAVLQDAAPVIRTDLDTAVVTVGDQMHFTIRVTHGVAERVRWPDSLDLAPFEVLDAQTPEPQREGDRTTSSLVLTLAAFEVGDLEIPRFNVAVDGTEEPVILSTDGWAVTVESVGLDEGGDIRDVKGPFAIPRNWLLLTPWVMALFAAVAAGYWMYRRYRLREVGEALVSSAPPRPPHEVAYEALEALERSPLLEQGKVKEYYIRVSDILRTYVERRYGVPALEMATVEVLEGLEDAGLHGGTLMDVRQFLELADLVKFAKHTPDPEACREAIPAARRLVDATQPQPQLVEATVA